MRLLAFTCGWLTGDAGGFVAGSRGRLRVPVPCFLIEHPRGLVLFDSGMHPQSQADPARHLGVAAPLFEVEMRPEEGIAARLTSVGVDPAAVDWLVTSHLHFDHTGGHASVPNATVLVQRAEWTAGHDPDLARRLVFDPANYDHGHAVRCLDGEHDLFGDGRIVCLPTPGHTPGHQSLRVRLDDGREIVLTADACYLRRTLEELALPPFGYDLELQRASLLRLRALRDGGACLIVGHDPDAWRSVAQAPAAM